jgi:hypothetical protein
VSPVIGADTIPAKKVNRKANEIMGLPNYPHVSTSFPTVTFGNENKSTPRGAGRPPGLRLRVKDVDFDRNVSTVRDDKGGKDRAAKA